ncbi:DUF2157 domain-containing protein [Ottowia sp.]|uniref:DUF2157 domain-containing protein n=1 Tax=Ottowia sp. TaxID=1898956 RepID=UPI003A836EE9
MHAWIHELTERLALGAEAQQRLWQLSRLHQPPLGLAKALHRGLAMLAALLLGAGLIFWVAANWQEQTRLFKLYLLEATVLLPALVAMLWPRGRTPLLLLATLALGGLLAFVGQTYQTGADPWQLFAAWAALALVWMLAARSDGLWAVWMVIAGTALALWTGLGLFDPVSALFSKDSLVMPFLWAVLFVWPLCLPRLRLVVAPRAAFSWSVAALLVLGAWCTYGLKGLFFSIDGVSGLYWASLLLVMGATVLAWATRPRDMVVLGMSVLALNVLVIAGLAHALPAELPMLTLIAAACVGGSGSWLYRLQREEKMQGVTQP